MLFKLFSPHEVDLFIEHTIAWQAHRPLKSEVEICLAWVGEESEQGDRDGTEEAMLF